jgi:hypothetical protein
MSVLVGSLYLAYCVDMRWVQLSAVSSALTSTLLWVSPAPTCSPLHFDQSEGILAQLTGVKHVTLAAPKYFTQLYPHSISGAHDRQSSVDDIHHPNKELFPLARSVPLLSGELDAGSLLYIPYGWWHQLDSPGEGISVSCRWNPYEQALRQAATSEASSLPLAARRSIQKALFDASDVPSVVREINQRRWEELAQLKGAAGTEALIAAATDRSDVDREGMATS